MTATAQIVTQHKRTLVLVPRRAVQSENGQSFVLIAKDGPPDAQTQTPANEQRPVTIGLSNSELVEIAGGLQARREGAGQGCGETIQPGGPDELIPNRSVTSAAVTAQCQVLVRCRLHPAMKTIA